MKQATPEFRSLARSLLAHEAAGNHGPAEMAGATEEACEKLRRQLGKWVGSEGFRVVLDRALAIAKAEFSFLESVEIETQAGCRLKGLQESVRSQDPVEANLALVAVLASLIWLLGVFMSKDLAMRQVRRAWPDIQLDEDIFGSKEVRQ